MRNYETSRLILRTLTIDEADLYRTFLLANKDVWEEWEPIRNDDYYEISNIQKRIQDIDKEESKDLPNSLRLFIFKKNGVSIIGEIALSNIVYGAFYSCHLGYKMAKDEMNKGYITEAIEKVTDIAFNELKLHRIEANVMPRNKKSERVLEKIGYYCEGTSMEYLKINGVWETHNHWVKINSNID